MADKRLVHSVESLTEAERIKQDLETRRHHLAENVAGLREAVSEKLDVRKRAEDALATGRERAAVLLDRARREASRRPGVFAGVALGVLSLVVITIVARERARPPRWVRQLRSYRRALAEGVQIRIGNPEVR